ncbi:MAG: PIN domain-containing protein [Caldilineaceae bacterium]|nr:PIN domain-containing protein [Caldilineaceae bacterium]
MSVIDSVGLFFLDTNILVYSFDHTAPDKQRVAQELIETALSTQRGLISTQVVQEFLNVLLRKFQQPMAVADAREYLHAVLLPLCQHFPSMVFYERALRIEQETGYSWYDALIIAAAAETGCRILISEDLQAGQTMHGVTIVNPFSA